MEDYEAQTPVTVWGKLRVHPTTALGIQAVMATGLAILLARGLNVDHIQRIVGQLAADLAAAGRLKSIQR